MARWNPTHNIIRNFAFGDPVKQYKKGTTAYLSGDTLDFAALNHCATMINPTITPVVDEPESSEGEGGDVT
jgi:hypothetical protein